jgi:hypothetical protein
MLILKRVTEDRFKHSEAGYGSPIQWSQAAADILKQLTVK